MSDKTGKEEDCEYEPDVQHAHLLMLTPMHR